jgi:hypothetical protein
LKLDTCGQTKGQTEANGQIYTERQKDMRKATGTFRVYANAIEKI